MASNIPAPKEISVKKIEHIRLKEAAWHMSVSYNWIYSRIVERKMLPFKRRGGTILIPLQDFLEWSKQDNIP